MSILAHFGWFDVAILCAIGAVIAMSLTGHDTVR
jgi:hypothetical protein